MEGTIIDLLSKNWKDIFITNDPEITFFKEPYKQRTKYTIQVSEERFNDIPNFGDSVFCTLNKTGDLIKSLVLRIVLPEVKINRDITNTALLNQVINYNGKSLNVNDMITYFIIEINKFIEFSKLTMNIWRSVKNELNNENSNYLSIMKIVNDYSDSTYSLYSFDDCSFDNFKHINLDILNILLNNYTSYSNSYVSETANNEFKMVLNTFLNDYIFYQKSYLKYLLDSKELFTNVLSKVTNEYYRFAWTKDIGLAIIDSITLEIGGQEINQLTKYILDDYFKLNVKNEYQKSIDKILGNIDSLVNFDSSIKPETELLIPIPFGLFLHENQTLLSSFNRFQDIIVRLKLSDLEDCIFFEPYETFSLTDIDIHSLIKIKDLSIYVEYIYLTALEKDMITSNVNKILFTQQNILNYNVLNSKLILPLDFGKLQLNLHWMFQKSSLIQMNLWNDYEIEAYRTLISYSVEENNIILLQSSNYFNNHITNYNNYVNDTYLEIYNSMFYNGKYKIIKIYPQAIIIDCNKFIYPEFASFKICKKISYVESENIIIHNNNLLSDRDPEYYTLIEQQKYLSNGHNIHVKLFNLDPTIFQPTGTLNFDVIKSKYLKVIVKNEFIELFKKNNDKLIVRIISGNYNTLVTDEGYSKIIYGI